MTRNQQAVPMPLPMPCDSNGDKVGVHTRAGLTFQDPDSYGHRIPDGGGLLIRVHPTIGRGRATLEAAGALDADGAVLLTAVLGGVQQQSRGRTLIFLDVSPLTMIDVTGLAALRRAHHQFSLDGSMTLLGVSPELAVILHAAGLDPLLPGASPTRWRQR